MRHRSLLAVPLLTVAALLLGACGGDDASDGSPTTAADGGAGGIEGVELVNDGQLTV